MKPFELTIEQALEQMKQGDLSAVELTESCLERIQTVEERTGAFITVDEQGALEQARQADRSRQKGVVGKLCGIPVSIKDLICTKDLRMTCGSKMLENFIPPYNATVIDKIQAEGAVIIGKNSMDEFAMGSTSENCAFTIPRNPWKDGYVAGGSSGGSAVAVAACESIASLGSDTGGSIRQPASLCSVVGMKPTYGRVSRYGLTAYASSLDQIGPLTRSVADCGLMIEVISGYDEKDSTSVKRDIPHLSSAVATADVKGLRVGIPREYFSEGMDPEVEAIVRGAIRVLKEEGAEVVDISLPHTEYCIAAYYIIASSEASSNLARYDGVHYGYRCERAENLLDMYKKSRSEGLGDEVKRRILIGTYALSSGYYDAYYKKAGQVRTLILQDFLEAFKKCDVLISPVTLIPAWKLGDNCEYQLAVYLSDILTVSANLAGIPGISVPGGFTKDGLPVGIQLQGAHFQEEILLRTARVLEMNLEAYRRRPEL